MSGGREPGPGARRPIETIPSALDRRDEIRRRLSGRELVVFLDYDGTLAPIADDPDRAHLSAAVRETLRRLSRRFPVAVMSGRDLPDVREKVALEGISYAGSHGFDVRCPDGRRWERGKAFLPSLDAVHHELQELLGPLDGVMVERKRYAVAVHFRRAPVEAVPAVRDAVDAVGETHDDLRVTGGKKIRELRPDVDWDKGRAVGKVLEMLGLDAGRALPVYVGDDVTDEDAFRAIAGRGLSFVVRGEDDARPSLADFSLADPAAVRRFLDFLTELDDPPEAPGGDGPA